MLWSMTPYSLVRIYCCLKGDYCLVQMFIVSVDCEDALKLLSWFIARHLTQASTCVIRNELLLQCVRVSSLFIEHTTLAVPPYVCSVVT